MIATTISIWTIKMAGIPMTKDLCFVLWRNVYIPRMEPIHNEAKEVHDSEIDEDVMVNIHSYRLFLLE